MRLKAVPQSQPLLWSSWPPAIVYNNILPYIYVPPLATPKFRKPEASKSATHIRSSKACHCAIHARLGSCLNLNARTILSAKTGDEEALCAEQLLTKEHSGVLVALLDGQ